MFKPRNVVVAMPLTSSQPNDTPAPARSHSFHRRSTRCAGTCRSCPSSNDWQMPARCSSWSWHSPDCRAWLRMVRVKALEMNGWLVMAGYGEKTGVYLCQPL
ncbi:hypothetical protein D3C79_892940 [compost metagenome]